MQHNLTVLMRGIWPAVPLAVATSECDAADSFANLELPPHQAMASGGAAWHATMMLFVTMLLLPSDDDQGYQDHDDDAASCE
ncbi:hypothetical protein T492DRAFT_865813 [Pavlovales sp. CCMP2436]|nr:hypothetical protein T492DRAFT_865813 [Pavlovales sp. CCMP2436]